MRLPGKESLLMKSPITINEILDVSISFLNDHLEETLGSKKNRRNLLKVYQSRTGKCFILIPNHRYVMT